MYITFYKESKKVKDISSVPFISVTSDLEIAEVKEIPIISANQFFTVTNVRNIEGKLTCDLVVNNKVLTAEQKQAKYENLVEKYIRQRYTLSQELAILRQRDSKPTEFANYNTYAEQCKVQAKAEVYGV